MSSSPTGVVGLDAVLCGGFPAQRTTIVAGGPGSGKTVLAMQFLIAGHARYGDPGLMISFEESPAALQRNWNDMTPPLDAALGNGIYLFDARIASDVVEAGSFDLGGLIAVITSLVQTHGIKRLAIDGIDAIFSFGDHPGNRRRELLRVLEWLGEAGITTLLTMKAGDDVAGVPPHFNFTEFAADGVIHLRSTMHDELLRRTLRIIKLRGKGYLSGDHAYTISTRGLHVLASPAQTLMATPGTLATRLSSGIERLDRMLGGGYRAGTLSLISGLPGTSKTTLAAAFLAAGSAAGERVAFVGFDEPAEQMVYDARSVGIDLAPAVTAGLLRIASFAAGSAIGDEHYLAIEALIDEHRPTRIVIDPISALVKAGGADLADITSERLAVLFKARGITVIFTAVSDSRAGEIESSPTRISTIADTWIHLSFAAHGGERNRTLTVVKSRGTAHSNQMREVVISDRGISLADVFTTGSDVLLGTARLRHEQSATLAAALDLQHNLVELQSLDEQRASLARDLTDVRRRIDNIETQRSELVSRTQTRASLSQADEQAVSASRFADPQLPADSPAEARS